jgi:hypothetical protein
MGEEKTKTVEEGNKKTLAKETSETKKEDCDVPAIPLAHPIGTSPSQLAAGKTINLAALLNKEDNTPSTIQSQIVTPAVILLRPNPAANAGTGTATLRTGATNTTPRGEEAPAATATAKTNPATSIAATAPRTNKETPPSSKQQVICPHGWRTGKNTTQWSIEDDLFKYYNQRQESHKPAANCIPVQPATPIQISEVDASDHRLCKDSEREIWRAAKFVPPPQAPTPHPAPPPLPTV